MSARTSKRQAPDLSELPPQNFFEVRDEFRSDDPMARAMGALSDPESDYYARIDLAMPMGCPFSLFLVRGYPKKGDGALVGTLVVSRELSELLAENLMDATVREFRVEPIS